MQIYVSMESNNKASFSCFFSMDSTPNITALFFIGIFFGLLTAYFARERGRKPFPWFFVGFGFGLLGFLVLFIVPNLNEQEVPSDQEPEYQETEGVEEFPLEDPEIMPWYYLSSERVQVGPLDFKELKGLLEQQQINLSTYVWCEGMPEWKKVEELNLFKKN